MSNVSGNLAVHTSASLGRKSFNPLRWTLIILLFAAALVRILIPAGAKEIFEIIIFPVIPLLAFLHGSKRYGFKHMAVFFVITWLISNFFESLSIGTGFPFGNYHYTADIPRVFEVPFVIMIAYFGMGYMAWTLGHIMIGQYGSKLKGVSIFLAPFIASFIMVMWDVVMDPLTSTIGKEWIWEDGGNYYGVPISNYFGWFFVVYVFMQTFALYIAKFDSKGKAGFEPGKAYWFEAVAVYGIQSLNYLLTCLTGDGYREIYSSMGLVCVFTMCFVTILSGIDVGRTFGYNRRISKENSSSGSFSAHSL